MIWLSSFHRTQWSVVGFGEVPSATMPFSAQAPQFDGGMEPSICMPALAVPSCKLANDNGYWWVWGSCGGTEFCALIGVVVSLMSKTIVWFESTRVWFLKILECRFVVAWVVCCWVKLRKLTLTVLVGCMLQV